MAALQERNGSYRVLFRYNGKQHAFTIGEVDRNEAQTKAAQVDYLLLRLKQRLIALPDGADIVTFVQFDGKLPDGLPLPANPRRVVTLAHLKDQYVATHSNGTMETNSLETATMHLRHFCRLLGEAFTLGELSLAKLQEYVNRRVRDEISPVTIRKEIASFRAAWNWGGPMKLTEGSFPNKGLRYPKTEEKPPFMTLAEIERRGASNGHKRLWDCLYLQASELAGLLCHVMENAAHGWIYPLFTFAAHTGARRSELLRALVTDVDFVGGTVLIHEKKRTRAERTTRRVPLTPLLSTVLRAWLAEHPGGPYLFCHGGLVARSKKRSKTTGYKGEKTRASNLKGRKAAVRIRKERAGHEALTRTEAHDHFKRTVAGSKWEMLKGFHVLRHSFISACASKGVDQRLIDEWVGHQTEQQRKRYRHLYPSTQQAAISLVFG